MNIGNKQTHRQNTPTTLEKKVLSFYSTRKNFENKFKDLYFSLCFSFLNFSSFSSSRRPSILETNLVFIIFSESFFRQTRAYKRIIKGKDYSRFSKQRITIALALGESGYFVLFFLVLSIPFSVSSYVFLLLCFSFILFLSRLSYVLSIPFSVSSYVFLLFCFSFIFSFSFLS